MTEARSQLPERVAELNGRVDELSARLQRPERKNWIDNLSSLSPLLSGVLIAAVGTIATVIYNQRQMQISHLEAVDKYRKYTMSAHASDRDYGYEALMRLGEVGFVVRIIAETKDTAGMRVLARFQELVPKQDGKMLAYVELDQTAQETAEKIMATANVPQQQQLTKLSAVTANTGSQGWAYLGHYVANTKKWKTRYFDFPEDANPNDLEGQLVEVRKKTGDLNVRSNMPSPDGEFGKVIGVFKPGSQTRLSEIQQWGSSGYMWAKVTYGA